MGTRGFVGFVVDGTEKIAYNHFDSYPEGLGFDVLAWLETATKDVARLREQARALRVVDGQSQPSDEDIERLSAFLDTNVGGRTERPTWYQLLRRTQGKPAEMLIAGVVEDASKFPTESLFAEWGYIVDLDAEVFEVYQGFQTSPPSTGRFAGRGKPESVSSGTTYYECALAHVWPFKDLPDEKTFAESFADPDEN